MAGVKYTLKDIGGGSFQIEGEPECGMPGKAVGFVHEMESENPVIDLRCQLGIDGVKEIVKLAGGCAQSCAAARPSVVQGEAMDPKKVVLHGDVSCEQVTLCPGNGTQYELIFFGPFTGPLDFGPFGAVGKDDARWFLVVSSIGRRAMLLRGSGTLALDYVKEKLGLRCNDDVVQITKGIGEFLGRPYQKEDGTWSR